MSGLKLKVSNIYVYTNLEVQLKSRTTKEEANKEVERMIDKKKLFEGYDWKIEGWQLPSSVSCIIRVTNGETGKVKEHVYQRLGAAENKVQSLMKQGKHQFVIVDHEAVHHLYPKTNAKHNNKADTSHSTDQTS